MLFWDDGAEQNAYIVHINDNSRTRFGFRGKAKTGLGDWLAGYRLEVEPTEANSAKLNQFDDDNTNDSAGPLNVRHSYLYLNSKKWCGPHGPHGHADLQHDQGHECHRA